jgi:hypothetical protein
MEPYFFMKVECIGNTKIIHMEETGITQRIIRLMPYVVKLKFRFTQQNLQLILNFQFQAPKPKPGFGNTLEQINFLCKKVT